ncbi:MAG TPA: SDR family NAD(P)-dependent oxidoreductase [Candidatus Udaeobacter sp.]|nr:SDR family NAD(P)-dependent oxidoreductase [Candidatus Udaeobacter sp.]
MPDENSKNVIDVNLTGTANTLRAVLPHMLRRKYGRIVIIASGQGRHGCQGGLRIFRFKMGRNRSDEIGRVGSSRRMV